MQDKPMKLFDVFGTAIWLRVMRRYSDNKIVLGINWGGNGRPTHSFDIYFNGAEALEFIGRFTAVTQECITAQEAKPTYEDAGTAHDPDAPPHERVGRKTE